MIRKTCALLLLFIFLSIPFFSVAAENDISPEDTWICLCCGSEATGVSCAICGSVKGVWICFACETRNLSGQCRSCGKVREESLQEQAFCSDLLRAFPAVRFLADQGQGDALCALAGYYEKGLLLPQDRESVLSCCLQACEAGYGPAYLLMGQIYDRGELVERDEYAAMEYFMKATEYGIPEAYWYLGVFYEEGFVVTRDTAKAMDLYRQAGEAGDAEEGAPQAAGAPEKPQRKPRFEREQQIYDKSHPKNPHKNKKAGETPTKMKKPLTNKRRQW